MLTFVCQNSVRMMLISWYSYKEEMLTERQQPSRGTLFMRCMARWAASGTEYLSNAVPFTRTLRTEISPNWLNAFSSLLLVQFWSRFSITTLHTMFNFQGPLIQRAQWASVKGPAHQPVLGLQIEFESIVSFPHNTSWTGYGEWWPPNRLEGEYVPIPFHISSWSPISTAGLEAPKEGCEDGYVNCYFSGSFSSLLAIAGVTEQFFDNTSAQHMLYSVMQKNHEKILIRLSKRTFFKWAIICK